MDFGVYKEFYGKEADLYLPDEDAYYRHDRVFNIRRFADRGENLRILDVGRRNSNQLSPLAKHHGVHGLGVSEANLKRASEKGIEGVLHDVEKPFP